MALLLRLGAVAAMASSVALGQIGGLVDIAPKAQTLMVDSDNWNYGQGVWAVTDGKDSTLWHQGNYGGDTATFTFSWSTPRRISEIITKTPAGSANYGYRSLKIMASEDGYGFRTIKKVYNQPCGASRTLRHSFHQWVTAKQVKLILSQKCGGNHFALSTIKIMADPNRGWRSVVAAPFTADGALKESVKVAGLGAVALLAVLLAVAGVMKLWRAGKAGDASPYEPLV